MWNVRRFNKVFDFIYQAEFSNGLTEHEFDHVFIGHYKGAIVPDPHEVHAYEYRTMESIQASLDAKPLLADVKYLPHVTTEKANASLRQKAIEEGTLPAKASSKEFSTNIANYLHRQLNEVKPRVIDAWESEKGLQFKAEIVGGSIGAPIQDLIKGGYLYSVSIGGDCLEANPTTDGHGKNIKKKYFFLFLLINLSN